MFNYTAHFHRDPNIVNGQTVFKGTRVPVQTVLCSLAEGSSAEKIIESFPSLTPEHVQAAIAYAAASAPEIDGKKAI